MSRLTVEQLAMDLHEGNDGVGRVLFPLGDHKPWNTAMEVVKDARRIQAKWLMDHYKIEPRPDISTDDKLTEVLLAAIRKRGHCLTQTACRDAGLLNFGDLGTEMENVVVGKNAVLDRANKVLKKALKAGKVARFGRQEWTC